MGFENRLAMKIREYSNINPSPDQSKSQLPRETCAMADKHTNVM
jgi:hypothetical protein